MRINKKLLVILVAAFILRVAVILVFKTYEHPVTWEHEELANNMLAGKGFVCDFLHTPYKSLNAPLYSMLCFIIYKFTGHSYLAVFIVQSIFSVLLAAATFAIGKMIFGETVGLMSAFFTAFHPGFFYYDTFNLIPLSIDAFFIAFAVYLFMRFRDDLRPLNMALVGLVIGIGTLSRGIIGSLLPFLALYILLFLKRSLGDKIRAIAILFLAVFLTISPWLIRNHIVQKQFIFIASTTGENLWRGNNEHAIGTSLDAEGNSIFNLWPEDFREKVFSMNELEQKRFFEKEALGFIKNKPLEFLKLYFKKIRYFWWFSPQTGSLYARHYAVIYRSIYYAIFLFFILGLTTAMAWGNKGIHDNTYLIILVFMAVFMTQSLFYIEGRHRWLIEPLIMIYTSYGIINTFGFLKKIRGGCKCAY